MTMRRILLIVSGGIAAYKAPELVRALVKNGNAVRCVTTPAASQFVAPLALQAVSGEPVRSALFDLGEESRIGHIELADWAELVVIAPATADLLAKAAHGLADDLASTLLLATRAPVLAAPAMNVNMWSHAATQATLATLRARGVHFIGPEAGELACGWEGVGRMSEPSAIAAQVELLLAPKSLAGTRVVVTAGGRKIAFTGDQNGRSEAFATLARGADVLIAHHAIPETDDPALVALHMTPSAIGDLAARIAPGRLVLSHHMQRALERRAEGEQAIRSRYAGPLEFADDLDCFVVE